jgi:DNA-binding MarR family transcriptional regulator
MAEAGTPMFAGFATEQAEPQVVKRAAAALKARQLRGSIFGSAIFGEPAWDMLIALYITQSEGRAVTVSGLAEWTQCPQTTALRWLNTLEAKGLIGRTAHPTDKRMHLVDLTGSGREALETFFSLAPTV